MEVGAAIWTFLNSPLGFYVVAAVAGLLFKRAVTSKTRRQKILDAAEVAFRLAEMMGSRQGLGGAQKYVLFMQEIVERLKAQGEAPELSEAESALLKRVAYENAWLVKHD